MLIISEKDARALIGVEDAIAAVEQTFAAMALGAARNYPVVREAVGCQDAIFGVKTGCDSALPLLGLKAGGYWPHNRSRQLGNHQSSTVLFDPDSGRASALVSANYLTGMRTGAASAVATKHLSRADSRALGIIGAGAQADYQLRATMAVRQLDRVHSFDPSPDSLAAFGRIVEGLGLTFVAEASCMGVAVNADILITVTPSQEPLVEADWVREGTHINAMGADTRGKQELSAALVARCAVFVDEMAQAISIGECQHAYEAGLVTAESFRGSIGEVAAGLCHGRRDRDEITLFDGTGVALQDLAVAALAVRLAKAQGIGTTVDY